MAHLLDLDGKIVTKDIAHAVSALKTYRCTTLDGYGAGWANAEAVQIAAVIEDGRAPNLARLIITQNDVGDSGAVRIATALDVPQEKVFLGPGRCPDLTTLALGNNKFSDVAVARFASAIGAGRFPKLASLGLSGNDIRDPGATTLAAAIEAGGCPNLVALALGGCGVSDRGATRLAAALASGQCGSLSELYMQNNDIATPGVRALAAAIKAGGCPKLTELFLFANENVGDLGATHLAAAIDAGGCPRLEVLNLHRCGVSNPGAARLAAAVTAGGCPALRALDVGGGAVGDPGGTALATMIGAGGGCPRLATLSLYSSRVGVAAAARFAAAVADGRCPTLSRLDLSLNAIGDPEFASELVLSSDDVAAAARIQEALEQHIARRSAAAGAAVAGKAVTTQSVEEAAAALQSGLCARLDCHWANFGDREAVRLAHALQHHTAPAGENQIEEIDLGYNKFGEAGAERLVAAVEAGLCPRLRSLDLHGNEKLGRAALARFGRRLRAAMRPSALRRAGQACVGSAAALPPPTRDERERERARQAKFDRALGKTTRSRRENRLLEEGWDGLPNRTWPPPRAFADPAAAATEPREQEHEEEKTPKEEKKEKFYVGFAADDSEDGTMRRRSIGRLIAKEQWGRHLAATGATRSSATAFSDDQGVGSNPLIQRIVREGLPVKPSPKGATKKWVK